MDWLQKAFDAARVKAIKRETFFSARREADVHLRLFKYKDGAVLGSVECDGERIYFGRNAEFVFREMWALEEAEFAIMRAQVRAIGNGRLPHESGSND